MDDQNVGQRTDDQDDDKIKAMNAAQAPDEGEQENAAQAPDEGEQEGPSIEVNEQDAQPDEAKKPEAAPVKEKPATPQQAAVVPVRDRNGEVRVGLMLSVAGLLVFWGGWMVYSASLEKHHTNYFSHSAWIFLIAYFLVALASFQFVRLQPGKSGRAGEELPRVDRLGVVLAAVVCGPFYGVYWYKAANIWGQLYPNWWWVFGVLFALMSFGVYYALRPPSPEDERAQRMPTRRVILLTMIPFGMVYGMIWLASLYPPWPS